MDFDLLAQNVLWCKRSILHIPLGRSFSRLFYCSFDSTLCYFILNSSHCRKCSFIACLYVLKLLFVLKSWTLGVYLRPTTIYFALDFTPIPELYTFHAMEKYIIYLPYRMLKRKNVNLTNRKLDSSLSICIN